MRKLYLFEIEADEKPIFNIGEWERLHNLTNDSKLASEPDVVAYGETEDGKYIELYDKAAEA
ncbi:hypothetical protein M3175_20630 [Robertmurraya korlensis]|uniref:hypothetical protein n=1 Tax=Robertmurraya korlensis TaxID=519977 RepID=UPI00203DACE9|nr:hypothetical protein [Robertmurraya korlensis]MCM3603149.1 hypothetical protein [Robertmurraya korlensis]